MNTSNTPLHQRTEWTSIYACMQHYSGYYDKGRYGGHDDADDALALDTAVD